MCAKLDHIIYERWAHNLFVVISICRSTCLKVPMEWKYLWVTKWYDILETFAYYNFSSGLTLINLLHLTESITSVKVPSWVI